jgi:hypothetical protein
VGDLFPIWSSDGTLYITLPLHRLTLCLPVKGLRLFGELVSLDSLNLAVGWYPLDHNQKVVALGKAFQLVVQVSLGLSPQSVKITSLSLASAICFLRTVAAWTRLL